MGIIFYISHQPGDLVSLPPIKGLDKLLHAAAYSVLAGSFLFALQPYTRIANYLTIGLLAILFCILYGAGDEFHQSFIEGRLASIWDVLADGLGALLTTGIWMRKEGKRMRAKETD